MILGLDLSLTNTGWYMLDDTDKVGSINSDGYVDVERLFYLETELETLLIGSEHPELAVIEGYSFASQSRAHSTGEWGGIARLLLRKFAIKTYVVAPQSLKKFVTGGGQKSKGKEDMKLWAFKRWGLEFNSNDECDACGLAMMGYAKFHRGEYEGLYGSLAVPQIETLAKMQLYSAPD